jgi:hypothetical protein
MLKKEMPYDPRIAKEKDPNATMHIPIRGALENLFFLAKIQQHDISTGKKR